jgi:hypothetical protein
MLTLLTSPDKSIVLYGYKENNIYFRRAKHYYRDKILFSGTKEELLSKDEEWLSGLVEKSIDRILFYKDYLNNEVLNFNAKDSVLSAISCLKEFNYILIVEENK